MPALLLHGFTHTGRSWELVRAALPRGYRAIAPDLRGHGEAAAADPVRLPAVIEDLVAVAPEEPFVLAGYSQGGRLALHLALDERLAGRVERLVLIGAGPGLADPGERAARLVQDQALAAELEGMAIEELAARWAQTPILAGLPEALARRVHEDRLRSTPAGLARALRGLGTAALPPLWERLGELTMEAWLLAGERDLKFTAIAEAMAAAMPAARVDVVPDAGHAVHLEAPESVARRLLGV